MKNTIPRKDIIKCVAIIVGTVLVISLMLTLLYIFEFRDKMPDGESTDNVIEYNGKNYYQRTDVETVLVMGLDKYDEGIDNSEYYNDQCADFMMLVIFDHGNKTVSYIHINRDTMAEMSVLDRNGREVRKVTKQITLAHSYGNGLDDSCRNTVKAVSNLLCGIKIDQYIQFTMDAIYEANDLVGGVTVQVLHDLSMYDPALTKGATVKLTAKQAEYYVRSRWYVENDSNMARMERQRQYLTAFYNQAKNLDASDGKFSADALARLSEYMYTDCTAQRLDYYFDKAGEYEMKDAYTYDGELTQNPNTQYMEFRADEEDIKRIVTMLLCKIKK